MTSRRVFLKNGGLALVSLGFAPEFLARLGFLFASIPELAADFSHLPGAQRKSLLHGA